MRLNAVLRKTHLFKPGDVLDAVLGILKESIYQGL